jgi:hypothetical protein
MNDLERISLINETLVHALQSAGAMLVLLLLIIWLLWRRV